MSTFHHESFDPLTTYHPNYINLVSRETQFTRIRQVLSVTPPRQGGKGEIERIVVRSDEIDYS